MDSEKKAHLHIRWGEEDEMRLTKIMKAYNLNRSDAVRAAIQLIADQIKIRALSES